MPDNDLRQAEWPDCQRVRSVHWNDDRTVLIFSLRDGTEKALRIHKKPKALATRPSHIDLTTLDHVDAILARRGEGR